jgi:hypothetical protein
MPEKLRAPARCKGLTGWPLGYCVILLMLFSRMEGYTWALVILFGPYCGFFDFEETIWWVRAHPSGVGLEGMNYPFKGFELSRWACMGMTKGRAGQ